MPSVLFIPDRFRDYRMCYDIPDRFRGEPRSLADHCGRELLRRPAPGKHPAAGRVPPDPPWMERPWIDRLAELTVPVTAVGAGPFPGAIARRAKDAEIVLAAGTGGMAPPADRARAAEAFLRLLDRVS